jgi:hypothetical protein
MNNLNTGYSAECASSKKSLMNSFSNLESKVRQLNELSVMSTALLMKFTNPTSQGTNDISAKNGVRTNPNQPMSPPDIIYLLEISISEIQRNIDIISENIYNVINIVE